MALFQIGSQVMDNPIRQLKLETVSNLEPVWTVNRD